MTLSTGNQMFISYTTTGIGSGKGFSASYRFGNIVANFSIPTFFFNSFYLKDNLCDTALDLKNGKLIVGYHFPTGTYCHWLISAQKDDSYVTLDFLDLHVQKNDLAS